MKKAASLFVIGVLGWSVTCFAAAISEDESIFMETVACVSVASNDTNTSSRLQVQVVNRYQSRDGSWIDSSGSIGVDGETKKTSINLDYRKESFNDPEVDPAFYKVVYEGVNFLLEIRCPKLGAERTFLGRFTGEEATTPRWMNCVLW